MAHSKDIKIDSFSVSARGKVLLENTSCTIVHGRRYAPIRNIPRTVPHLSFFYGSDLDKQATDSVVRSRNDRELSRCYP